MLTIKNINKLGDYKIQLADGVEFRAYYFAEYDTYYEIKFMQNTTSFCYSVELGRENKGGQYSLTCHGLSFLYYFPAADMIYPGLVLKQIAYFLPLIAPKIVKC